LFHTNGTILQPFETVPGEETPNEGLYEFHEKLPTIRAQFVEFVSFLVSPC